MRPNRMKRITILSDMTDTNSLDTNEDVLIELENGYKYVVIVVTAQNLVSLMDDAEQDFVPLGLPFIIVREVSEDIIWQMEQELLKFDAHNLKRYALDIPIEMLNEWDEKRRIELQEIEKELQEEVEEKESDI